MIFWLLVLAVVYAVIRVLIRRGNRYARRWQDNREERREKFMAIGSDLDEDVDSECRQAVNPFVTAADEMGTASDSGGTSRSAHNPYKPPVSTSESPPKRR